MDYSGDFSKPAPELTTMKLHVNSSISYIKSRFISMDVKYFYLNNHMDGSEYIMIHISMLQQVFVDKYNLKGKAHKGYTFAWVTKGMYGIPQVGQISRDALVEHLEPYGYCPSRKTLGLWTHINFPINFTLLVDDFGVKYPRKEHTLHLKASLKDNTK